MTNKEIESLVLDAETMGTHDPVLRIHWNALIAAARRANELEAEVKKAKAEGLREAATFVRACIPPEDNALAANIAQNMRRIVDGLSEKAYEVERNG